MSDFRVLLYYCYTSIEDPERFREAHHKFCADLGLRGRIIVAAEGLNGTVSGPREACERYMAEVKADPRFADIDFKVEAAEGYTFKKLNVRHKPEIVHSDLHEVQPREQGGDYVEPEEFRQLKDRDDVVVVDVRSNYEHSIGRFKNAVTLDIDHFREFKDKVKELAPYKDKKVVTYCTGGIKCEKASAWLREQGFENVYQLHGGIIKYGLEEGGEDFEGKCYVFDSRITKDVNQVNPTVIGECYTCGTKSDRMVNCANPKCNKHVPICEACGEAMEGACSQECRQHPEKRPYNGTGYYQRDTNGYNPYKPL